jgi:predicted amidohydrolase
MEGRRVKILAAAVQFEAKPGAIGQNLDQGDAMLRQAHEASADLVVFPEMFNTGYGVGPDYARLAEDEYGPTLRHLHERSRRWQVTIAAGFVEESAGHLYDSLALFQPDGRLDIYRKRHLVFWECSRFRSGRGPLVVRTAFGRMGFAVCADMIYRRVWNEYRDRIDVAVVASAWPDFRCRESGRPHWLYGRLGPLAAHLPSEIAKELKIPFVFANQCGETTSTVPILQRIRDRFAGQSAICDGVRSVPVRAGTETTLVLGELSLPGKRGGLTCHSMFHSARVAGSSTLAA